MTVQDLFLVALSGGNTITAAAAHVGVDRRTVYHWRDKDPEFAQALEEARESMRDTLRTELRHRAFDRDDPRSAMLLLELAKANLPEFKRTLEVAGGEKPIVVEHRGVKLTDVLNVARAAGLGPED